MKPVLWVTKEDEDEFEYREKILTGFFFEISDSQDSAATNKNNGFSLITTQEMLFF